MPDAQDKIRTCVEMLDKALRRTNLRSAKSENDGRRLTLHLGNTIELVLQQMATLQQQQRRA